MRHGKFKACSCSDSGRMALGCFWNDRKQPDGWRGAGWKMILKLFNPVDHLMTTETGSTDYESLPQRILPLDKSIRFCGVANKLGYIIASRYRQDLKPLMTNEETERYALFATIRNSTRQVWENKLGRVRYALTRYELLVRVTVPLASNHLLLLSFDVDTKNIDDIMRDKVMPVIDKNM